MNISYVDFLHDSRWINFISAYKDASIFHHPSWSALIARCYGYRSFAVTVIGSDGRIVAGLPMIEVDSKMTGKRWISLPFTDHCMPLASNTPALETLMRGLLELQVSRRVPRIELRWPTPAHAGVYHISRSVLHVLELEADPDVLFTRLKKTQFGRNIARSEREGVVVRRAEARADMDAFYRMHLMTRQRQGTPVQPKHYFDLLWADVLSQGLGFLLLAYKDREPIAGAVFLNWNHILMYKYGASDPQYWALRPNHALFSAAIRWGCENTHRVLDFGKTDNANQGLRAFKSGWNALEQPLTYSYISDKPQDNRYGLSHRVLGTVIRRSPPIMCRALGELLYKHSA